MSSKSKEAMADEYIPCLCGEVYTSRKMVAPDCPRHAFALEEVMTDFAKQESISFVEWVAANNIWWNKTYKKWTGVESYTTEQLYQLYLKQVNNK